MPEISRFFGLGVTTYYADHPPPHVHVRYGAHQALVEIRTARIIGGSLPVRAAGLVAEWAAQHREELVADWDRARRNEPLAPIAPLE